MEMDLVKLPPRTKTDLDDDRAQILHRTISTNFFKTKLDAKNRDEFLSKQLEVIKHKKKQANTRITRTIKETLEQVESLHQDQQRALATRMRRQQERLAAQKLRKRSNSSPELSRKMLEKEQSLLLDTARSFHVQRDPPPVKHQCADSCRFLRHGKQCDRFPCTPCGSYNRMGYFLDDERTELNERTRGLTPTSHELFWEEIERTSVIRPLRQPYNRAVRQERALDKMMKHMRQKNENSKPKDWSVKYGDPTPLRKILNPVRA